MLYDPATIFLKLMVILYSKQLRKKQLFFILIVVIAFIFCSIFQILFELLV
jgi:hypothetical protein